MSKQFDVSHFEDGLYRFEHGDLPEFILGAESKDPQQSWLKRCCRSEIADLIAERVKDGELSR